MGGLIGLFMGWSVGRCVGRSVGWEGGQSVRVSVRPSVRQSNFTYFTFSVFMGVFSLPLPIEWLTFFITTPGPLPTST